jgi:glucose-6-phosphate 1-dehydrogenase
VARLIYGFRISVLFGLALTIVSSIIGVAADDWSIDRLRKHAHESIEATGQTIDEAVFDRFAAATHLCGLLTLGPAAVG